MREQLDFLQERERQERRKYLRFHAPTILNTPIVLAPLPPFFGSSLKGRLVDLSAGGMAIRIAEAIPERMRLSMSVSFPDRTRLECQVQTRRCQETPNGNIVGIQFLDIASFFMAKIDQMARAYNECEDRIASGATDVCNASCSFFRMCDKPQKTNLEAAFAISISFGKTSDAA